MSRLYSLKGFIDKGELLQFSYDNFEFKSIKLFEKTNKKIEIHSVEINLKEKIIDEVKILDGSIFDILINFEIIIFYTDGEENSIKILNIEDRIFEGIKLREKEKIFKIKPYNIDFNILSESIVINLIVIFIKGYGELKKPIESDKENNFIDEESFFL